MTDDTSRARDRAGSEAHYRDGALYDQTYRRYRSDIRFYVGLALESGGPVLELGAGTGRVSLALAKAGVEVVSVDKMPTMLERLRERLAKQTRAVQARVTLREGDLRSLRLRRRFPLVISPFNVFMHLYERQDVEAALATARRHLEPAGLLAFDVLLPDPGSLARRPDRYYSAPSVKLPSDGERYDYAEAFRYDPARQVQTVSMVFTREGAREPSHVTPLAQRQFFPQELAALLHYNRFEVLRHDGGFSGEAIDAYTESQVLVARPRRR